MPLSAYAAESTFFGPIVPPECNCEEVMGEGGAIVSSAADWGCVLQTVQNGMNFAISISFLILLVSIVYAGVLFMSSAANPRARESGRRVVTNAFLGIVLIMSAWLLVDFLMKILYNPATQIEGEEFGPWNEILGDGSEPKCILPSAPPPPLPAITTNDGYADLGRGTGTGACDPALVQRGAAEGGHTLTNAEANTLACIARFESTCGARNLNYRWGRGSSAAGPFQVLLDGNSRAYENAACYQAAGVAGPLNCDSGFSNGNPIAGSPVVQRCVRAAANLNCSASAAAYILRRQGFGAWTTDPNSAMQQQCIRGAR
jgi:hypothetical protein